MTVAVVVSVAGAVVTGWVAVSVSVAVAVAVSVTVGGGVGALVPVGDVSVVGDSVVAGRVRVLVGVGVGVGERVGSATLGSDGLGRLGRLADGSAVGSVTEPLPEPHPARPRIVPATTTAPRRHGGRRGVPRTRYRDIVTA
jgi:hypothetical protein